MRGVRQTDRAVVSVKMEKKAEQVRGKGMRAIGDCKGLASVRGSRSKRTLR